MGIFDALFAQDARGEQLRGGLLGMGVGLMNGSVNDGGRFAPAMAQGLMGFQSGTQNAQKNAMMQQEMARKQQLQQLQMVMAQRLSGGGGSGQAPGAATGATPTGGAVASAVPSGQGGGMSFNDYQAMMALGVPGAKEAFEAYKYANPVERRQGNTYIDPGTGQERYMPKLGDGIIAQNGQAMAMPGYAGANAQIQGAITGAQESARYPYTLGAEKNKAALDPMQVVDPVTGAVMYYNRANVASSGATAKLAPAREEAIKTLHRTEMQAENMIKTIDGLANHPGLPGIVGMGGNLAGMVPGTDWANAQTVLDQLQGQAFLQAFESLKGGGAITEVEGKKAEQSIARLNQAQSLPAFKSALDDLKGIINTGVTRAREKAGASPSSARGASPAPQSGGFSNLWGG